MERTDVVLRNQIYSHQREILILEPLFTINKRMINSSLFLGASFFPLMVTKHDMIQQNYIITRDFNSQKILFDNRKMVYLTDLKQHLWMRVYPFANFDEFKFERADFTSH